MPVLGVGEAAIAPDLDTEAVKNISYLKMPLNGFWSVFNEYRVMKTRSTKNSTQQ